MSQLFFNNARGVLAESISTGSTLIKIKDHANIPTSLTSGDYFLLTLFRDTTRYGENIEVVKVTAITAGTNGQLNLTVERGYEFPAQIHTAGARLEARLTAQSLRDLLSEAKSFTQGEVAALLDAAPGALDTLNELAAALGDDPNFAATMTAELAKKLDKNSYTAADVLAKLLTVDGAGTGLDADTLDGKELAAIEQEYMAADQAHVDALNPHPQYAELLDDSATLDWNFATGKYARDNGERVETTNLGDLATVTRPDAKQVVGPNGLQRTAIAGAVARQWNPVTGEAEGVVNEKASKNLLKFSESFEAGEWSKTSCRIRLDGAKAPDGSFAARKIIENTSSGLHHVNQPKTFVAGSTYTISYYVRAAERSAVQIQLGGAAFSGTPVANYDLSLSTAEATGGDASITDGKNGWFRISLTATAVKTAFAASFLILQKISGSNSYQGDGKSGLYIWGAQLEKGDKPTSYIPTPATFESRASTGTYFDSNGVLQTAAIDQPRENHVLVDGEWVSQGLLIEPEAKTNKLTYSEAFDNTAWSKSNVNITSDTVSAPDGALSVDKLVEGTTLAIPSVDQLGGQAVIAGKTYVRSVFAKPDASGRFLQLHFTSQITGTQLTASFDLTTGEVIKEPGLDSAGTEYVGNGFYRCYAVITALTDVTAPPMQMRVCKNFKVGNDQYTGDGTSGFYLWGAQFEEGTQPSSYIKTTDTSVTRAADVVSSVEVERAQDDLTAPLTGEYNPRQGTWVIDAEHNDGAPLTGIGLDGAYTSGKGKLVYSYDENGGEAFANGAKVFDTPPVKKAQTVGLGHQTTGRVQYFPKKLPVAQAIARATGSVAVDYPFADGRSFYTDFNANDYGVQNYQNAVETVRTDDPGEVLTVERNSPTWVLESDGVYRQVASNVLAREWNPETGKYQAQISGAVTNELLWSTDFSNAPWTGFTTQWERDFNSLDFPLIFDGNPAKVLKATRLTAGDTLIARQEGLSLTAGESLTASMMVYFPSGQTLTNPVITCDLNDNDTTLSEQLHVDKWARVSILLTPSADRTRLDIGLSTTSGSDNVPVGTVVYIAVPQLVKGNVPGPVIVTEDTPVTRDADLPKRMLGDEFDQSNFTLVVDFYPEYFGDTNHRYLSFQNTLSNRLTVGFSNDTTLVVYYGVGGVYTNPLMYLPSGQTVHPSQRIRLAISKNATNVKAVANGGAVGTATAAEDWSVKIADFLLGRETFSTLGGGKFSETTLYPYAMTDTQLQELTTL